MFAFVVGLLYDVCQVLPLEAHAEDVERERSVIADRVSELVLDIFYDGCSGGGSQREDRGMGHQSPYAGYGEVAGSEVVSPLADAMGFVDADETDVHVRQLLLEEIGSESLWRDIQ